jgi:hypothetical protein
VLTASVKARTEVNRSTVMVRSSPESPVTALPFSKQNQGRRSSPGQRGSRRAEALSASKQRARTSGSK